MLTTLSGNSPIAFSYFIFFQKLENVFQTIKEFVHFDSRRHVNKQETTYHPEVRKRLPDKSCNDFTSRDCTRASYQHQEP